MVAELPASVKELWKEWNIRSIILFSLGMQTFLIFVAPARKRASAKPILYLLWTAYLLADWAANFAVGHISSQQNESGSDDRNSFKNHKSDIIKAFWAPFLLVHLGGPDTITAYALEDNELWIRHLLGLITQVLATVYVFIQTIPGNELWIPTILMITAGIIKYTERTRSLYLASLNSFRDSLLQKPDPGPNYAKLMEEYSSKRAARLPTRIEMTPEPIKDLEAFSIDVEIKSLSEIDIVNYAHYYYVVFRGLIVDSLFSFRERNESREFFLRRKDPVEAFRVLEVELNFMYEALFTKVVVVHTSAGYVFRFIAFAMVIATLVIFFELDKDGYEPFDVWVTYLLLYGAIILDVIAMFMVIFSDWTVVSLQKYLKKRDTRFLRSLFTGFLRLHRPSWSEENGENTSCLSGVLRKLMYRRWSETILGYNLITYCLKENPDFYSREETALDTNFIISLFHAGKHMYKAFTKSLKWAIDQAIDYLGMRIIVDEWKYAKANKLSKSLWRFVYEEIKGKASEAEDPDTIRRIFEAKGTYVLEEEKWSFGDAKNLAPYIDDVAYDEGLLLWHIATELCYEEDSKEAVTEREREVSKTLSEYMVYLLVLQPTMMSAVAGIGQIRFRDTAAEAKKFFARKGLGAEKQGDACAALLEVCTEVEPVTVKGDRSKSVVFEACRLAKQLREFRGEKWTLVSKVWVEMMSYAASHCRPETHAQQVSKGGELLTFVWLLMAHFGLGHQFQINEGHSRAKLIVEK